MRADQILLATVLVGFCSLQIRAEGSLQTLRGACRVSAVGDSMASMQMEPSPCKVYGDCGHSITMEPLTSFSGISASDFRRQGVHITAALRADSGKITCSGSIDHQTLSGEFSFVPDASFATRLKQMGFDGLDSNKLEAYTLLHIDRHWIESLESAGVVGLNSANLIGLRATGMNADYAGSLKRLGYPSLTAAQLLILRMQGVDARQIEELQDMGYHPTQGQLVQMCMFKITPEFVRKVQAHGFKHPTVKTLIRLRMFNLVD